MLLRINEGYDAVIEGSRGCIRRVFGRGITHSYGTDCVAEGMLEFRYSQLEVENPH